MNTIIDMLSDQRIRVFQPNSQDTEKEIRRSLKKTYFYAFIGSKEHPNELLIVQNEELGRREPWPDEFLRCDLTKYNDEDLHEVVSFIKRSVWGE